MPKRPLISEAHVRTAVRNGKSVLHVPANALITPLAHDTARMHGVRLETTPVPLPQASRPATKRVALGCDHGGFAWKKAIADVIAKAGWAVVDLGTNTDASCDYPDFARAVAEHVQAGTVDFGVMIDGAGLGSAMVCNKVSGVRAACAYNEFAAWNARAHNNANVLTLGSRTMGIEVGKRMVQIFLETAFEGGRHQRRVDKIEPSAR